MTEIQSERGKLILRLAQTPEEIAACQRLRYHVFYEEMNAQADENTSALKMDCDRFDAICDHLLVVHRGQPQHGGCPMLADGELIGTYRLLQQDIAEAHGGFYTQAEFDIAPLISRHSSLRFLELGRSCVLKQFRTKPVVELLWQGIWDYVRANHMDVMLGCASLEGTDPDAHAFALSFLADVAAPPEWKVRALPSRYVDMRRIPPETIDKRRALSVIPPLIKGYLRLGCYIGDGAVIDRQFNTIDVLIILPVSAINPRYFAHFGPPADTTSKAGAHQRLMS